MRRYLFGVIALLLPGHAAAQQDTIQLPSLVVTATRVPLPVDAVPAAVTVLDGDALRQKGVRTVADALRTVPSAQVARNGSYGSITSLFLRGGESDYVQVLVDGVRVNNPGGLYDFANLTMDNVERIEIVRGPVSVLYGSDAMTGVVQVFTRDGSASRSGVRMETGSGSKLGPESGDNSYRTTSVDAYSAGRIGDAGWSIGGSHFKTDGLYAYNNAYRNRGVSGALDIPAGQWRVDWSGRYNQSYFHYPTDGSGNLVDRNAYRESEAFTTGVQGAGRIANALDLRAGIAHHRYDERYADLQDSPDDTLGTFTSQSRGKVARTSGEVSASYAITPELHATAGGELEQQSDRNRYASDGEYGPFESSMNRERQNRAAFVQLLHATPRFSLTAGGRFDDNDRFGTFGTYRAGLSIAALPTLRLRASVGTAFKEPNFFENYAEGFTKGNPELEPEQSRTIEAGAELSLFSGRATLGATRFHQKFRDLIQYVSRPFGSELSNYSNLAGASANGTELELRTGVGRLTVNAAATFLETRVTDAGTGEDPSLVNDQRLLRRPDVRANASVVYSIGAYNFTGAMTYVGERDDLNFNTYPSARVTLDAYTTVDAGVRYTALSLGSMPLAVTLRAVNLLDQRYEETFNFPSPGRSLHIGVEVGR